MSKYYTLEEVRSIRNEISKLGERKIDELEVEYDKAWAEWDKVAAELNKEGAECDKAKAEWIKVGSERDKAVAEWNRARAEWDIKLFTLLIVLCPEAYYRDWNGYLAISKNDNEEWILPVWTGNYNSIEHTAFSIWTMPRGSCNEEDAREVKDE
ncbi:MAG: hypothetical protein DDT23_00371 [candidate division WS2 bacterium]|nr:hypothetical protein [Candidatus Lithacetigena glycinireducens]